MRNRVLLPALTLLALSGGSLAQAAQAHDGFYLSMSLSAATGDINTDASNGAFSQASFSGTGAQLDLRIGGAVSRNNILSCDISSRTISGPTMKVDGTSGDLSSDTSASDALIGIGFTHYFMPANAYIGVTLGQGNFSLTSHGSTGTSENGFGYILRAGKDWRVSRNWAMGVVGGVAHLSAKDKADSNYPNYNATITTTRVFLGFSTTFN